MGLGPRYLRARAGRPFGALERGAPGAVRHYSSDCVRRLHCPCVGPAIWSLHACPQGWVIKAQDAVSMVHVTLYHVGAIVWCSDSMILAGHGGWLTDGVVSMSGAQAVTSSGDELAVVWDMHQGNCLNVLEGHSGEVRSVVLTRRGRCAPTSHPCRPLIAVQTYSPEQRAESSLCSAVVITDLLCCLPAGLQ